MSRILAALFLLSTAAHADAEVQALLRRADAYRLTAGASRVESSVESYKSGALDKERRYVVYLKSNRRSLVLSRSPIESGQKFQFMRGLVDHTGPTQYRVIVELDPHLTPSIA